MDKYVSKSQILNTCLKNDIWQICQYIQRSILDSTSYNEQMSELLQEFWKDFGPK